jgi:protein transport protein SEC9
VKANLAERAKYQFEADEEDDQLEDEIDANLDALSGAAGRLNLLARGN